MADLSVFGKGYLRSRVGVFFALIFPVILILLFGAIFSGGNTGPVSVYYQNLDSGAVGGQFAKAMNDTGVLSLVQVGPGVNFSQYLQSKSAGQGIVIPQDFSASFMLPGKHADVLVYQNPSSTTSQVVLGITREVVDGFNLRHANPNATDVLGVRTESIASAGYKYVDFLVPGLIGFSILTSPMFALVNISSEYKRDKIFKQLSLTPLTKTEWLLSKIVWYIMLTALSFVLMSVTGIYLFGAHVSFTWGVIPFLILGPFMFVSLGMLIGTVSNSPESAAVVGNLITFPMMFLSGTFFPVNAMPGYLQGVAHVLPLFYVIEGINNVMIYSNYAAAYFDLGVMVAVGVAIFTLAVRFFKWRED